jgi:hypothetical protein
MRIPIYDLKGRISTQKDITLNVDDFLQIP